MLQIKNTLGGGKPEGLYVWKKSDIGSELKEFNKRVLAHCHITFIMVQLLC